MLRTVIVDDEAPARERLKTMLSQNGDVEMVGEAEDGIRAVEMIEEKKPDLVLLDIQMPGLDGFGVIKALDEPPMVIFVTAYDDYAIRAFEVNALDYLLKPFTKVRLDRAIERASLALSGETDFKTRLEGLFKMFADQKHFLGRIAVRSQGRMLVVEVDEIDSLTSESGQVSISVADKRYLTNYTLNELQSRLDPGVFFRAHRSAIVNLTRIKEMIPWFAGSYKIKLKTGAEVELSRIQATELRKIIEW
jgi:DNA-binding LytR/AlgR family response regulator